VDDLSSLLLAAIEETERLARGVTGSIAPWEVDEEDGQFGVLDQDMEPQCWPRSGARAMHIAHNDPASVLRRSAADRRLLELHKQVPTERPGATGETGCDLCRWEASWGMEVQPGVCETVLTLAEGYGITDHQEGEP
jgi:hypothetical protein